MEHRKPQVEVLQAEPDRVDLWYVRRDEIAEAALFQRYRRLLSGEEYAQWRRYRVEHARQEYLVTRALARCVLSAYGGHPPQAWTFRRNRYGKPFVDQPPLPGVAFNLSNTRGLVICAVTGAAEIGVDVERVDRAADYLGLARRFFAPSEAAVLEQVTEAERAEWFFRFWTLKESYIKARGMGLSIPLDGFAFSLEPDRPPCIEFVRRGLDEPDRWRFVEIRLKGDYQIAATVAGSPQRPLEVCLRPIVPLQWEGEPQRLLPQTSGRWRV